MNQGCNISPYFFLLCSEVMTHQLYLNEDIKGLTLGDIRLLISQFADDTVLYVNFGLWEIEGILSTFLHIEANTGLKINYNKTMV